MITLICCTASFVFLLFAIVYRKTDLAYGLTLFFIYSFIGVMAELNAWLASRFLGF